jgi:hypothetical protein
VAAHVDLNVCARDGHQGAAVLISCLPARLLACLPAWQFGIEELQGRVRYVSEEAACFCAMRPLLAMLRTVPVVAMSVGQRALLMAAVCQAGELPYELCMQAAVRGDTHRAVQVRMHACSDGEESSGPHAGACS